MYYLKANIENPLLFSSAGNFIASDVWRHAERIIDSFEIIFCIRGIAYIQQDDIKFKLIPGDMMLLLPGCTHKSYEQSEKGTSFYWLHFYCSGASEIVSPDSDLPEIAMYRNNPYFDGLNDVVLIPAYLKCAHPDRISVLLHQLLHVSQTDCYTGQGVNYLLTSLLIELTQQTVEEVKPTGSKNISSDKFQRMLEWIRINMTKAISLQDIAYEFNYAREYLCRYFKKNMGMSIQSYIYMLRIAKAKELLCHSDSNVSEIARLVGFSDEKYFMKLFKSFEKTTPKQFRNAYHLTHLNDK